MNITAILAQEFEISTAIAETVVALIDEGNTIPFIARYRKEKTGAMDDQKLRSLSERLEYLRSLDKRREQIGAAIEEQGKMTDEIRTMLESAQTLAALEDVYRPFKQKRRTRAMIAREKGVEPLAKAIMLQRRGDVPERLAQAYISEEKGVPDVETAIQLAQDIIAEDISDDAGIRAKLRELVKRSGMLRSVQTKKAEETEHVYGQYADYKEPVMRAADHRILALNRGEREEMLKVTVDVDEALANQTICRAVINPPSACCDVVRAAAKDAWSRLIGPSLEREIRSELTDRANVGAIRVFGQNLAQLLMQPPVRGKVTLGVDPGFRTGCKLAVVDETGRVLDTGVIYPQIQNNPSTIYSFLLVAGYLKSLRSDSEFGSDYMCEVAIPNKEISFVYSKEILSKLDKIIPSSTAIAIQEAIYAGDSAALQKQLHKLLLQSASYHDTSHEIFYHGLVLGLCAMFDNRYDVTSNRESGEGRYDIQLFPLRKNLPGILIELKAAKGCSDTALDELAQNALQQINDRKYDTEMLKHSVAGIIKYGVAFCGKKVSIATENTTE